MNSLRRNYLCWRPWLLGVIAVAGCTRQPPLAESGPPDVVICQPYREKIQDYDVYTGLVEAKENVDVRAKVQAYIKEVKFKEGDEVKAGDLLFVLDDAPFQAELQAAQGELETWQARLKLAEEQITRYKDLVAKGSAAKEDLDKAYSTKGEAIGGVVTAKGKMQSAQVNVDYCKITAPISGKIGQALLTKGNLVNAAGTQSQLTTIVSVDPMYVYFFVNERAVLEYQERSRLNAAKHGKNGSEHDKPAVISVDMALATEKDFPHKGIIDFVDNRVDPNTGSLKVRAKFDNPKAADGYRVLTSGLFARVSVQVHDEYPAVLIADRAVLTDQNLKYVLIVNKQKKNQVERVDVTLGRLQEDGLRVIKSGLKGDEWVIVEGVNRIGPGAIVNPKDGPMPRLPVKKTNGAAPK